MLAKTKGRAVSQTGVGGDGLAIARQEPLPPQVSPPTARYRDALAPVTVVIVNHDAGSVLTECLDSVLGQAREVVLVDNASAPKRFESLIAPFVSHPRLEVVRLDSNTGFAAGCNRGAELATQPFVLFLNPDCFVHASALERLCDALSENPRAAMAGGRLIYPDGSEQGGGRRAVPTPWRSCVRALGLSRLSRWWPKLFDDFYLHFAPLPTGPIAVEAISGACMLVKRDAMNHFGIMDEGYFLHCEDLDLCMRARSHGWEILFVPDAQIVHHKGGCSDARPVFVEWHKHRGMIRFYDKHFRHLYPAGLMELMFVGVWMRFAVRASRLWITRLLRRRSGPDRLTARSVRRRKRVAGRIGTPAVGVVVSPRPLAS